MPPKQQQQREVDVFWPQLSPDGRHVLCEVKLHTYILHHVVLYRVADDGTIDTAAPVLDFTEDAIHSFFWHCTGASWELLRYVADKGCFPSSVVRCVDGSVAVTFAGSIAAKLEH